MFKLSSSLNGRKHATGRMFTCAALGAFSSVLAGVCAVSAHAQNLVTNGDFSAGNTGFTSQYDGSGAGNGDGFYSIDDNAWGAYGDHTTGTGLLMLINGSQDSSKAFWAQSVAVEQNTTYTLSAWIANTTSAPYGNVDFKINGVSVGSQVTPSTVGQWLQFSSAWNSGSASTADLAFYDIETAPMGNDFTIDDISLTKNTDINSTSAPEPGSVALLAMGGIPSMGMIRRRRTRRAA